MAVWSVAGVCDGFTTVLWLTEQPDAASHAATASVMEAIGGGMVTRFSAEGIDRSPNRSLPPLYSKYPSVPAGQKGVNERGGGVVVSFDRVGLAYR